MSEPLVSELVERGQNVALRLVENVKGDGAVMHLERREVIVEHSQVSARIYLERVTEARMIEIVAER